MFWILLWVIISMGLFIVFAMTLGINLRQVRAWKAFATKTKLTFVQKHILQPPAITGTIYGYDVRLHTVIERNDMIRRSDVWSFIEVDLKSHPSVEFVISKSAYQGQLTKPDRESFHVESLQTSVCEASNVKAAKKFLTKGRIKVLEEYWALKNQDPMILCNATACTLISRTSAPLAHPKELNEWLKAMTDLSRRLDESALKVKDKSRKA